VFPLLHWHLLRPQHAGVAAKDVLLHQWCPTHATQSEQWPHRWHERAMVLVMVPAQQGRSLR